MRPQPSIYTLFRLVLSLSPTCPLSPASAQLVNRTIDDTSGDLLTGITIQYVPTSLWRSGNQSTCTNCTAQPDATRAYGETWHEGASLPSPPGRESEALTASVGFIGSAVYVYCIVAPLWSTDLTFYLDEERAKTFALAANSTRAYEYGVLVYAAASLRSGEHTLTILSGTGGGNETLVLLDRIAYTRDTGTSSVSGAGTSSLPMSSTSILVGPSPTPNSQPQFSTSSTSARNAGLTAGVIIGAIVMTAVVGGSLNLWKRYRRRKLPPSAMYRQSVGAGAVQGAPPETRVVGAGGDLVTSVRGAVGGADLEAAAAAADGDIRAGPQELERTQTKSGRGTPHHEPAPDGIEEVSRS